MKDNSASAARPVKAAAIRDEGPTARKENHRSRVGRERRARMRTRILNSVMVVCANPGYSGAAVIDDVIRHAEGSRGTFYKYFDSLEEAVTHLAQHLADEMGSTIYAREVYDGLSDPVLRTATGFQMFLIRAMTDPEWASFVTHIGLLNGEDSVVAAKVKGDIRLGVETGDYQVISCELAADLLMGAKHEAIRRIIAGERDLAYVRGMTEMVLRSFQVAPDRARLATSEAHQRLVKDGAGKVDWWDIASHEDAPKSTPA